MPLATVNSPSCLVMRLSKDQEYHLPSSGNDTWDSQPHLLACSVCSLFYHLHSYFSTHSSPFQLLDSVLSVPAYRLTPAPLSWLEALQMLTSTYKPETGLRPPSHSTKPETGLRPYHLASRSRLRQPTTETGIRPTT